MFILIYFSMFFNQYAFEFILRERWASFFKWWCLKFWGNLSFFSTKWLNCWKPSKCFNIRTVGYKHYICKISSLWAELEQHLTGHIVMLSFVEGLSLSFRWVLFTHETLTSFTNIGAMVLLMQYTLRWRLGKDDLKQNPTGQS